MQSGTIFLYIDVCKLSESVSFVIQKSFKRVGVYLNVNNIHYIEWYEVIPLECRI